MDKKIMGKRQVVYMELGYYNPSNANWSYGIWLVIDYTGAKLYRETFGGDYRMKEKLENKGYTVKQLHVEQGSSVQYKWRDIKDLQDIEDYEGKNRKEGLWND